MNRPEKPIKPTLRVPHFHQPPNALVIQLKRFGFDAKAAKIDRHVDFGHWLKLDVSGRESPVAYDLTG